MNKIAILRGTGQVVGPAVLAVGASLSTLAIIGTGGDRPVAQAPPSSVAATPPTTSTNPTSLGSTPVRSPHPSPRPPSTAVTVVSAGREVAGSPGTVSEQDALGGGPPGRPSPAPQPPATSQSSSGVRAAVRLSHPLGTLPDAGLHVTVGGRR